MSRIYHSLPTLLALLFLQAGCAADDAEKPADSDDVTDSDDGGEEGGEETGGEETGGEETGAEETGGEETGGEESGD